MMQMYIPTTLVQKTLLLWCVIQTFACSQISTLLRLALHTDRRIFITFLKYTLIIILQK